MALRLLKLPDDIIISRSSITNSTYFSYSLSYFNKLSVRWVGAQKRSPCRSFTVVKSAKVQASKKKRRLDEICVERFQQYSRTLMQSLILQGKVFVDGKLVNNAGTPISDKAVVEMLAEIPKYVCIAGHKLEAAIEKLDIDVSGNTALDSGFSTVGYTDCLLQYVASFVYGVDVGYAQVADKIRRDERVCVIERTNLGYLSALPQKVDLVTLDLSFISILLVMPAVVKVMKDEATLITLVKPQFEARRSQWWWDCKRSTGSPRCS
ncbi:uncharacterized protein LOC132799271 [Ziziphus jujuba]|uniref:Uncharacterized protein LOC107431455 n=1 Tax=Ziziphus jujuba TaxID=326968 RepID=A0ABM4A9I1_ZIZJJ|nr:uncharacterized protein LOC107431455 [Ziziphus jujuba]XP_060673487.1 uncharacterized protein LOC132799271 [Ziziphus jujuba]